MSAGGRSPGNELSHLWSGGDVFLLNLCIIFWAGGYPYLLALPEDVTMIWLLGSIFVQQMIYNLTHGVG